MSNFSTEQLENILKAGADATLSFVKEYPLVCALGAGLVCYAYYKGVFNRRSSDIGEVANQLNQGGKKMSRKMTDLHKSIEQKIRT